MHFLSEHDYDRKKVMSVLQGNQKSAVRFAFWKRLKELEGEVPLYILGRIILLRQRMEELENVKFI